MKKKYKREMEYVYAVISEMERKLDKPIRDLDDVRMIMDNLKKIREQEVDMELRIDPIEVRISSIFFWRQAKLLCSRKHLMPLAVMTYQLNKKSLIKWTIFDILGANCFPRLWEFKSIY